ncbi:hypothetical protein ACJMK2_026358 [Sinanodonta woodiana]|uniref:Ig-like domain-containing protein n=1 Tax=Sinanodonta woodiana TaxID=1069815 RepID=A0ABD3XN17_SINWO
MNSYSIVKPFIVFNFLTHFAVCKTDPLLAFTGCNATLQWDMSYSSYEQERTDFRIIDNAGDVIATKENNQCMSINNLSMSCILSHKNDAWIMSLTLMNITTNHTGNYTAWIKKDDVILSEKKTKPLIVIDKPRITELRKPLLHKSFSVMCTTSYTSDCVNYYWKINGSDLQDSIHLDATMSYLAYRNVTMMDNFSRLTCRAGTETCINVLCNSSEDSDPYTIEPHYGPMYVSLTHNESHIYLEENTSFKVKCSADCYPACAFRWESYYINVDSEELLIENFNERYSGPYICTARNRETGVSAKSSPLLLHYATVTTIHSNSQKDDTEIRSKLQARAEQADSEVSRADTWTRSRAQAYPLVQKDLFRRTNRLDYPKLQIHFRSLEELSYQDKDVCHQHRDSMFLQTHHSSNILDIKFRDDFTKIESTSDNFPYNIESSSKECRLLKRFARTKTSGMVVKDYHETGTNSQPLISLQRSHDGSKLQEYPYHTIDENVLTVYDYSTYNAIGETAQETERRPDQLMYYYGSSSDACHIEAADVHVTDEGYLSPISDLAHKPETGQLDETDMNGTDKNYITIINDCSGPVEESNLTEADLTYITPIA